MTNYVNRGPDRRPLGEWAGWIQARLSFKSWWEPLHVMVAFPPYVSIAIPKLWTHPLRYATFRAGWRYDKNWPGYIFDVIVKLDFDRVVPY